MFRVRMTAFRSGLTVAHNGSRLCAGGALKHESFNPPLNLI